MRNLLLCPTYSLSDPKVNFITLIMIVVIIMMIMATLSRVIFIFIIIMMITMNMSRVATANRPGPDHLVFTIRDVFKEKFAHNFGQSTV